MAKQRRTRVRVRKVSVTAVSRPAVAQDRVEPVPPSKRGSYLEAVSLYESGLTALQRREFGRAAELLRSILDRYPEERELHERVRLYLRVCERANEPPARMPSTPKEQVYAATLALNAGRYDEALEQLRAVVQQEPQDDGAQYMLALAYTLRGQPESGAPHLERAIELNPENRGIARQDPDLEALRNIDGIRVLLDAPHPARRRIRGRSLR